jgi:hypothetical protein
MLEKRIRVFQNPWSHTVPSTRLVDIVAHVASVCAEHVEKHYDTGGYPRDSLGLAVLNPEAPRWQQSGDTLLFTIAIGPEGERFISNAIAKAVYHRDHGVPAGYGVYMDLTMSGDGDFCYGYSTQVDGTIGGVSAQSELQDAMEAGHAIVTFNYMVRFERKTWLDAHTENRWLCDVDEPRELYAEMASRTPDIYDSGVWS